MQFHYFLLQLVFSILIWEIKIKIHHKNVLIKAGEMAVQIWVWPLAFCKNAEDLVWNHCDRKAERGGSLDHLFVQEYPCNSIAYSAYPLVI